MGTPLGVSTLFAYMGSWFSKKAMNMTDKVNVVEKRGNDIFYLTNLFDSKGAIWKTDFNMSQAMDKENALLYCTPFATVIRKVGAMFANGRVYLTDSEGNDVTDPKLTALFKKPNPLQNSIAFFSQIEMVLRTYGYCPIYTNRIFKKGIPRTMWSIHPTHFHLTGTGKSLDQVDLDGIVKEAYVECGTEKKVLNKEEYFIIYDSDIHIPCNEGDEITFGTAVDSLSIPVSNWMASMQASNSLITNGGPKGIIYNNDNSETGNASLNSTEQKSLLDRFKRKYGLMKSQFQIAVSRAKLGWIPLNYNSDQLKLHEEDKRCTEKIANAIGLNPSLFNESKFENQESAKRAGYQDLIIPNAEIIAEAFTENVCPEGTIMKIDFSHVECLQADKSKSSEVLQRVMDSMIKGKQAGLITGDEGRSVLAEYIDIDPEKPKGDYGNEE